MADSVTAIVRFGVYKFDRISGTLFRGDDAVRLQEQPARVLAALLENPGELVTRDDLRLRIWPSDTFVQFDGSLNTAIRKVRYALRDDADNPVFIETVPRQGYRFIAPVHIEDAPAWTPPIPAPPAPSRWPYAALAAIVVLAGVAWRFWPTSEATSDTPIRLTIPLPDNTRIVNSFGTSVSISADGQTIAFAGQTNREAPRIWLRSLKGAQSTPIQDSQRADFVTISPDGKSVLFAQDQHFKLYSGPDVPIRAITRLGPNVPQAALWGRDGNIYLLAPDPSRPPSTPPGLWRVSPTNGNRELLLLDTSGTASGEWYLPLQQLADGRLLISTFRYTQRTIEIFDPATRKRTPLHYPGNGGLLTPTNWLLFHEGLQLRAIQASLDPARTLGAPFTVLNDVMRAGWSGGNLSVSANGTLVYVSQPRLVGDRKLVWVDPSGKETPSGIAPGPFEVGDFSPNGEHVILYRFQAEDSRWSLNVLTLATGNFIEVSRASQFTPGAVWNETGTALFYTAEDSHLARRSVFPLAPPEPWTTNKSVRQAPSHFDVARKELHFSQGYLPVVIATAHRISATQAGPATQQLDTGRFPTISPDGNWMVAVAPGGLWLRRYPLRPSDSGIYIGPGTAPIWSRDGRTIYLRRGSAILASTFTPGATPTTTEPKELLNGDYALPDNWIRAYALHPTTQRFLLARRDSTTEDAHHLNVILNWFSSFR